MDKLNVGLPDVAEAARTVGSRSVFLSDSQKPPDNHGDVCTEDTFVTVGFINNDEL